MAVVSDVSPVNWEAAPPAGLDLLNSSEKGNQLNKPIL